MKTLIILLVLAVVATWWIGRENRELTRSLSDATETVGKQKKALQASQRSLTELRDRARSDERAHVLLREQRDTAEALANRRNQTITRLLNENEALRRWYVFPLPDDVIRLHRRPAFTNPDDYLRWLSENQQLPDTGKRADH
ncbi:MAG: Rz-like lysis system protein LysB [Serratia liquefaciens]|jgi:LysB family phage lysis regulatory protein|nr:Rz-like lysis system protein LysB [Serratia liquefaciens]MCI1215582.1 Rz-like lysis system protein LysB [Serratia liquefaciens]MCI1233911.1 Rz-like lysis system protein LysB [Serratia liquefaciens]MCI1249493.1 Rz-like lysis system protein LysB [Serratia liquefaciens]MCI1806883.1 Rz-like lysis system protein LysB [Serratia liquefaciens]